SSEQLTRVERLGQIVIGADLRTDNAIDVIAFGRYHQHRRVDHSISQTSANRQLHPRPASMRLSTIKSTCRCLIMRSRSAPPLQATASKASRQSSPLTRERIPPLSSTTAISVS